jgi:hypothetical protein
MHTLGIVALIVVATLWAGAFAMWILGLPRAEARPPRRLATQTHGSNRRA